MRLKINHVLVKARDTVNKYLRSHSGVWTSDMVAKAENVPNLKIKFRRGTCSVCETPGPVLFCIPSNENRYKKWFSILKWNVPPEQLKSVLNNARVCDRHFSESCFTSTLRKKLIKFACPDIINDLPSASSDTLSALPSAASQCTCVEVCESEPECSKTFVSSPAALSCDTSGHLQVTSETRKLKF
ncbi:hypothetical protein AVEN_208604-1 [Araneus ventricosus]|uniref:THAP-type domain-containing protein n=1 Tax=Araneus ventricosus TaxID=182803 RepID=A0A4Y2NW04_ARAVE|nr:hypothetical protein AVEN_208604-1 [Araneus ventricosus]